MFVRKSTYQKVVDELKKLKSDPRIVEPDKAKDTLVNLNEEIEQIKHKITSKYQELKDIYESLNCASTKKKNIISELDNQITSLKKQIIQYEVEESKANTLTSLTQYVQKFDGFNSTELKEKINNNKERQKSLIKKGKHFSFVDKITVNSSYEEGLVHQKKSADFAIVSFNSRVDAILSTVKYNNFDVTKKKIIKQYNDINKYMTGLNSVKIRHEYLDLRLDELRYVFEFHLVLQEEKDKKSFEKEVLREEQKAQKEFESFIKTREKEEKSYQKSLSDAERTIQNLHGVQLEEMQKTIQSLKNKLLVAVQEKERAMSQAQLTRSGYVYVISNEGAFGQDIYKIGMTRRLEPMDRVKELGDASVPFIFDVHAIIQSDDAPSLEAALHKRFINNRVNKINNRKEFFKVKLDEIKKAVREFGCDHEFNMSAEAIEYNASLNLIK